MIDRVTITPLNEGFTIDLHGELGAILAIVDTKGELPDAGRSGSSLTDPRHR
jgi:hypothetical protein